MTRAGPPSNSRSRGPAGRGRDRSDVVAQVPGGRQEELDGSALKFAAVDQRAGEVGRQRAERADLTAGKRQQTPVGGLVAFGETHPRGALLAHRMSTRRPGGSGDEGVVLFEEARLPAGTGQDLDSY